MERSWCDEVGRSLKLWRDHGDEVRDHGEEIIELRRSYRWEDHGEDMKKLWRGHGEIVERTWRDHGGMR